MNQERESEEEGVWEEYIQNLKIMKRDYDFLFKIVLIGDSSVGKSSLLVRFSDDTFNENYITTIGVDFRFRTLPIEQKNVKLQIWDTAGQERYRTITNAYYRGADAIIITFDLANKESFHNVKEWMEEVDKYSGEDVVRLIVGNKSDLEKHEVTQEDIEKFEHETGLKVIEASAKTAHNVDEAFITITRSLIAKKMSEVTNGGGKTQKGVKISYSSTKKGQGGKTLDGLKEKCCSN